MRSARIGKSMCLMRSAWTSLIRDVWESVMSAPTRAALSLFALSVGVGALFLLVAGMEGLNRKARGMLEELGGNVVVIESRDDAPSPHSELTRGEVEVIRAALPKCRVSGASLREVSTASGETLTIVEADEIWTRVRRANLVAGRFLDRTDLERGERHVVISEDVSSTLRVGVGETVRLAGDVFTVVGVMGGNTLGALTVTSAVRQVVGERTVVVPYTCPTPWKDTWERARNRLSVLVIEFPADQPADEWVPVIQNVLEGIGKAGEAWAWTTPGTLLQGVRKIQKAIAISGGSVVALCLVLGGTTLMSLMIANVRDRIAEIGLRRALGATASDIVWMFVFEGCCVVTCALVFGTMAGRLVLFVARHYWPVPTEVNWSLWAVLSLVVEVLGAFFASGPALLAARIVPAEALRND